MTTTETTTHPVLLGLREIQRLFPRVAENTVYRWHSDSGGRSKQLPDPHLTVSGTPMWTEQQIVAFADRKGLDVDAAAMDAIRASQSS